MAERLPRLSPEEAWVLNEWVLCKRKADGFEEHFRKAQKKNKEIVKACYSAESIDLYLASSMRSVDDVRRAYDTCTALEEMDFSVFAPANSCETSIYRRHDLEKRMLIMAKGLLIDAGDYDTGGKFIEASYMKYNLVRPVFMLASGRQYKVYHDWHPSSIMLGVHVAENLETLKGCIRMEFDSTIALSWKKKAVENKENYRCSSCDSVLMRR